MPRLFHCTFHGADEGGTVSGGIPTRLHTVSATRLVVPLTLAIVVIVIAENSWKNVETML